VILDDKTQEKPEINYPCEWGFKLIGTDQKKLEQCIGEIMGDRAHSCTKGNVSNKGKFLSMNTKCEVASEEERNALFKAFSDHDDVKMVI